MEVVVCPADHDLSRVVNYLTTSDEINVPTPFFGHEVITNAPTQGHAK